MAYKNDKNLEFLSKCTNEELEVLFNILVYGKDGETRVSEFLTVSDEYKKYGTNYKNYWKRIAEEYQYFGSNSIVSIFRGTGVEYNEILNDVMDKLKISYDKEETIKEREDKLILETFTKIFENLPEKEKIEMIKELEIDVTSFDKQMLVFAVRQFLRMGGFKAYQITLIVANTISKMILGKGLTFGMNTILVRSLSFFTGPIVFGLTTLWTVSDLAGPALRVTVPATIMISCLRRNLEERTNLNKK